MVAGTGLIDSAKLARDSANFEVYSAKLCMDSANFGTYSAVFLDDSAKPLLNYLFYKIGNFSLLLWYRALDRSIPPTPFNYLFL
jgi:hypothetical protein